MNLSSVQSNTPSNQTYQPQKTEQKRVYNLHTGLRDDSLLKSRDTRIQSKNNDNSLAISKKSEMNVNTLPKHLQNQIQVTNNAKAHSSADNILPLEKSDIPKKVQFCDCVVMIKEKQAFEIPLKFHSVNTPKISISNTIDEEDFQLAIKQSFKELKTDLNKECVNLILTSLENSIECKDYMDGWQDFVFREVENKFQLSETTHLEKSTHIINLLFHNTDFKRLISNKKNLEIYLKKFKKYQSRSTSHQYDWRNYPTSYKPVYEMIFKIKHRIHHHAFCESLKTCTTQNLDPELWHSYILEAIKMSQENHENETIGKIYFSINALFEDMYFQFLNSIPINPNKPLTDFHFSEPSVDKVPVKGILKKFI